MGLLAVALTLLGVLRLRSGSDGGAARSPRDPAPRSVLSDTPSHVRSGTAAITGRVQARGEPVAGAWVCAARRRGGLPSLGAASCMRAGAGGEFSLRLEPGGHVLWASAPGFVPAPGLRGRVEVRVGQQDAPQGVVLELVPGGQPVAGRVSDALGGPVEGAWVAALDVAGGRDEPVAGAVTDPDGRFRLWARPGAHDLAVRATGYASVTVAVFAPAEDVQVRLLPEAVLEGRIVPDPALPESPASLVVWATRAGAAGPGPVATAPVDDGGRFRLGGLGLGTYELRARGEGVCTRAPPVAHVAPAGTRQVEVPVAPCPTVTVTVRAGDPPAPCSAGGVFLAALGSAPDRWSRVAEGEARLAGLSPGRYRVEVSCAWAGPRTSVERTVTAAPAEQAWDFEFPARWEVTGSLEGRVLSHGGDPVPGASVEVPLPEGGRAGQTTAPDGRFAFSTLPAGRLRVWARGPTGLASAPVEVEVPRDGAAETELRLAAPGRIEGRVLEAEARAPVAGAWVELDGPRGGHAVARTGEDGRFSAGDLAGATYRVTVADAVALAPQEVTVPEGGSADVEILVDTTRCDLSVAVLDAAGDPVPEAAVEALAERWGAGGAQGLTAADGRAALEGLLAEPHTISATDPAGREAKARVDPCASEELVLTLSEIAILAGQVVDDQGRPVPHATVGVQPEKGVGEIRGVASAQGTFRIEPVPAGVELRVAARGESGRGQTRLGPLAPGATAQVEVRVHPTVTAVGRVVDVQGEPVAGAWVVPQLPGGGAADVLGPGMRNRTGDDGRFDLVGVPPGRLEVMLNAPGYRPGFVQLRVPDVPPHDLGVLVVARGAPPRLAGAGEAPAPPAAADQDPSPPGGGG